jgi:hypothetical protein
MPVSSAHRGLTLWGVALLLVGAWGCGSKERPPDWVAAVESYTGTVTVAPKGQGPAKAVAKGQVLRVGDRLETASKSEAVLVLRNGGRITVKPDSVVLFRSRQPEKELSLALEQGSVLGTGSKVEGGELVITVGERKIRLSRTTSATVVVGEELEGAPKVLVTAGEAVVEGPGGKRTVVAGQEVVLIAQPDAAPPTPDAGVEPASKPTNYFLRSVGRGRVLIKRPGEDRFTPVRRGQWVEIPRGTLIKLLRRARAQLGPEKGKGSIIAGPGVMLVKEGGGTEAVRGEIVLSERGKPGTQGSAFEVDGVTITPRVTHEKVDVRIRRKARGATVMVVAGEAELKAKDKTVVAEAGQEVNVVGGTIGAPRMPPPAPFQVKHFGTLRVFTGEVRMPVTFRWKKGEAKSALVQVSRYPSMARALFADVIKRQTLTIPGVTRGSLHWQVTPIGEDGQPGEPEKGRLLLIKDTSHRVLKDYRPPRNTIHESFGNTTVFFQNRPPRFTFTWNPIEGAARYHLKVFREQNLQDPVVSEVTKKTKVTLRTGKLGEGTYLWYVVGRKPDDSLVRALKGRKLSVRFDNATPDVQIVYPRNGITVGEATIEAKGVTIPGSKVFIDGKEAELDKASRFSHPVSLKPGVNYIYFRVVAPKRGASIYLRRVTRK